jgi:adenylate cyclase
LSTFTELKRRNVLRVGAAYLAGSWLLIQIADTLIPLFELPDTAGRVLVIVLAIGFVPALLTAWLFELTPEGFRRESSVSHESAESVHATRRFDRAIIAVLTLAVVVFAVDRFVLDPARDARLVAETAEQARRADRMRASTDQPSIAVLAFDDLSPDGDLEYFSDGISIELMDLLTKIPNLRVIARESAFWFKGREATYAEIGAKLGVGRLLEGTVQVAGDQVRVTARLIDPGTEEAVWAYSPGARPMTDIFAIQTEIATEVVEELRIALTGDLPALDQTTPEIHSLYLQARHILETGQWARMGYARDVLKQSVEDDPNFFPARNWLAVAYYYLSVTPLNVTPLDRDENRRLWESTSEQAALRWPDRPEIMAFRAMQRFLDQDYATAAQYLERSLRQNPSPSAPWAFAPSKSVSTCSS